MISVDASSIETTSQRACIEYPLRGTPPVWTAEAWFNPVKLGLNREQTVYVLHFIGDAGLYVAARLHKGAGPVTPGIVARNSDGSLLVANSDAKIVIDVWRKWTLRVSRIGTREATAVLYLDGEEAARLDWDATTDEPRRFRAGIGRSSAGATASLLTADLRIQAHE